MVFKPKFKWCETRQECFKKLSKHASLTSGTTSNKNDKVLLMSTTVRVISALESCTKQQLTLL